MRKSILFAAAAGISALSIGGTLYAQGASLPGAMDVARVEAGTYQTDPGHSLIGWRVNHFGFNDYFGLFGSITGSLTLDPKNPGASKLDVTIPVSSITTANAGLTAHLLKPAEGGGKPDFFGAEPAAAHFVSTKVEATGGTTANITGDLTLNGATKPVVIAAEFTGAGDNPFSKKKTVGFEGRTSIKRSDFGVAYGIPMVSDEVQLEITVAFEK
jgi:polyisoprenoid-binding protein YceI